MKSYGRQTAKLKKAILQARVEGVKHSNRDELYNELLKHGFNWDGKTQSWDKNNRWLGSAFEDAHGKPTGHVKLRVMTHPQQEEKIVGIICEALQNAGIEPKEVSESYPNRKGVGVRTYISLELKS